MKKKVAEKVLAVVMAVSMAMSVAGCGNDAEDSSKESSSTAPSEGSEAQQSSDDSQAEEESPEEPEDDRPFAQFLKDEEAEDLNGYEFVIVDFGASRWYPGGSYPEVDAEAFDPTKEEHVLKDEIIKDVEEKFNCHIKIISDSPDNIVATAQSAIMAGDKFADLIVTTQQKCGPLIVSNGLLDLKTVDKIGRAHV